MNVAADASLLCDKDSVLGAVINDTVCMSMIWKTMMTPGVGYIL